MVDAALDLEAADLDQGAPTYYDMDKEDQRMVLGALFARGGRLRSRRNGDRAPQTWATSP